jgi:uncharacterized protein YgiM (DUF1202 family)
MYKAMMILSLFLIAFTSYSSELSLGTNYVNVKTLNVRNMPSSNSKVIGSKIYRQMVTVKEFQGDWARISRYNSKDSQVSEWVFSKFLASQQLEKPKSKYETNSIFEHIMRTNRDKGKYFLVYLEKKANTFIAINQRVGVSYNGYTKTEINCANMMYRVLGYTEGHIEYFEHAEDEGSKWSDLVPGSSKSDLVNYVCAIKN